VIRGRLIPCRQHHCSVAFSFITHRRTAGGSFPDALREAGSSLFTLGFAVRSGTEPSAAESLAAASGLIIVALQIAYLPTLYAAYHADRACAVLSRLQ
jgi:hypothetical protein